MLKSFFLFFLLFISCLYADDASIIQDKIDLILKSVPKSTKYGVMIYNPKTHNTLYQKNIEESIKPASNTKLFTCGVALSLLGSNYELSTKLLSEDYDLKDGVINGNLYLKGFGNSLFTDSDIDSLVSDLYRLGIREIKGNIVGDDSYFDSVYHRSDWIEDEWSSVPLSPVSAIVINRNRLHFYISGSAKINSPVNCSLSPYCSQIKIINNASVKRRRSSICVRQYSDNKSYEFIISGGLRRNSSTSVSIDINNPPLFAALLLSDRLERAGIKVTGKAYKGVTPQEAEEISSKSISLSYLLKVINKRSDNYLAECLFKTIGAEYSDEEGNAFYATQAVLSFLKENDIYSTGTSIVDGSGISHYNQVTVRTIVELLNKIYYNPLIFPEYYNSLAIAGVDGTLRGRMGNTLAENNFHGKTGTLNGVIALSGYLKSNNGDDLIISIIFEFQKGSPFKYRYLQDQIIDMLTSI